MEKVQKYITCLLVITMLSLVFISCKRQEYVEIALNQAGKNRVELEKVLFHYRHDSVKYKAACFLISNMPYHFFYGGPALENYYTYYRSTKGREREVIQIVDSLENISGKFSLDKFNIISDLQVLDSTYLVQNIDWAFKVWKEQPWGKNVSFTDFCEYILPYKIDNEKPSKWREHLYYTYNPMLDSVRNLPQASDPAFVAKVLLDSLSKSPISYTGLLPQGPHIGPQTVNLRTGSCREFSDIVLYVFRALGIPCGEDLIMRGDNNDKHFWCFANSKKGECFRMELSDNVFCPAIETTNPKGKVRRLTYSINRTILKTMDKPYTKIHPAFRYPLFLDVTSIYAGKWNQNLKLSQNILHRKLSYNEVIYLCIPQYMEWIPIDWTIYKKDSLHFFNVEGNIVSCLATWNDNKLQICSDPFFVNKETGNISLFHTSQKMDTMQLFYKFPLFEEHYIGRMVDGTFEGSNDNFLHVDTLHIIKKRPERLYNTCYTVLSEKTYKYVRYKGRKDSHCNIAEIIFYGNNSIPLQGKVIGTPGCYFHDGTHEYTNAFDGNPYTSFDYVYPSNGWTGLQFSHPQHIHKVVYVPRNRDNFIRKGDFYELFFWKNEGWQSGGYKQAQSDSLLYIVPKGTLYYLKNHTRGTKERVFEYKNGKQIFR